MNKEIETKAKRITDLFSQTAIGARSAAGEFGNTEKPDPPPGIAAVVTKCLKRILHWHVPRNWSTPDWTDEIQAVTAIAAWEAECCFDSSYGVPIETFVRSRVLGRTLTRYRQEWAYAARCMCDGVEQMEGAESWDGKTFFTHAGHRCPAYEELLDSMTQLVETDRWLIQQLFWNGRSEAEIGRELGIGQRAVNKRKAAALMRLQGRLAKSNTFATSRSKRRVSLQ